MLEKKQISNYSRAAGKEMSAKSTTSCSAGDLTEAARSPSRDSRARHWLQLKEHTKPLKVTVNVP